MDKKILIGSPICQDNEILKEFLISLKNLNTENLIIEYCFIDDNKDIKSRKIIENFQKEIKDVILLNVNLEERINKEYYCDDITHRWNNFLIEKVAYFKNEIIKYFLKNDYDYLFFIDSDIVLHEYTLQSLISHDKDIISNIFWTKWNPNSMELPQVWLKDLYTLYNDNSLVKLSNEEINKQTMEFLTKLRIPGVYKVGGLGACTLIKREPLEKGVNFNEIYNISFWGEDRFFCIRAVVYGYELFVDTHYPAYHIYRKKDLSGIENFKKECINRKEMILSKEGIEIVNKFLDSYYRYSFNEQVNTNWQELVEEEEKNKLIMLRKNDNIYNQKIIAKVSGENWNVKIIDENELNIKFTMIHEGIKAEYSFYKKSNYSISLKKINSKWLISKINKKNDIDIDDVFVRKVRNKNKLTLSMIVKNEEGRYLEKVLNQNKKYIDNAVIVDDCSTDRTKKIIKEILKDIDFTLIENNNSLFENEVELRKFQWEETIKTDPDWILNLDADEVFESSFEYGVRTLIESDPFCDVYSFRLYDFWNEDHYREDNYWNAHTVYRPFLVRYQKNYNYKWLENKLHCGRFPHNIFGKNNKLSAYRLKHYGWAKQEDRVKKYQEYISRDPKGIYGNINQYISILEKKPKLIKWEEEI